MSLTVFVVQRRWWWWVHLIFAQFSSTCFSSNCCTFEITLHCTHAHTFFSHNNFSNPRFVLIAYNRHKTIEQKIKKMCWNLSNIILLLYAFAIYTKETQLKTVDECSENIEMFAFLRKKATTTTDLKRELK